MKVNYYRVSRLVVLPDYQGIGIGKKLLDFTAQLYVSQTNQPFYILTSNPAIVRSSLDYWEVTRLGHASAGRAMDHGINYGLGGSYSGHRLSATLRYLGGEKI